MAKHKEYKKLPGKHRSFSGLYTLYLGPDHLLFVDSGIGIEKYKRFYYNDIQAVVACKIKSWSVVTVILFLSVVILWSLSYNLGTVGSFLLKTTSVILFFAFLVYLFWIPSCKCYLKTAIQTEKLPSLNRFRIFKKVMEPLTAKIGNAQGHLTSAQMLEKLSALNHDELKKSQLNSFSNPARKESGSSHKWLFYTLFTFGLFHVADLAYDHVVFLMVNVLFSVAVAILTVTALVRQYNSNIVGSIRKITWLIFLYVCANFMAGYIIYFAFIFKNAVNKEMSASLSMINFFSGIASFDHPWLFNYHITSMCICIVFGLLGLIALNRFQSIQPLNE